ncbi:MAG: hypothetical protein V3V14_08610 [Saprospiraceae bacterium]
MDKTLIFIIFSVFGLACGTTNSWESNSQSCRITSDLDDYFASKVSKVDLPIDITLYQKLKDIGVNQQCALSKAFVISEVVMERQLPSRCDRQYFRFEACKAYLDKDTLFLIFDTHNPRKSLSRNKLIKVKIFESDFVVEVIHWGAYRREKTKYDGTTIVENAPQSKINKTKFMLNQTSFEVGDTLIGEIRINSSKNKKRCKLINETTAGTFRVIINDINLDCDHKSLVTSFLK